METDPHSHAIFSLTSSSGTFNFASTCVTCGLILVLLQIGIAQNPSCDTTLAVERWSDPVLLPESINQQYRSVTFPWLSADAKTLYFCLGNTIYKSHLSDTGWSQGERLSDRINRGLVQSPALSPDGKELYFIAYTTGGWRWDIWMATWSDSLNDWNEPARLDTTINSRADEWTVFISRDGKKMYFATNEARMDWYGNNDLYESERDSLTGLWKEKKNLGKNINYPNYCGPPFWADDGASVTGDNSALYFAKYIGSPYNFELFVSYWQNESWSKAKRLNVNSYAEPDSIDRGRDVTGWEYYPTISPDGKTLIFSSRRNYSLFETDEKLYISRLIVDRNGDSVSTGIGRVQPSLEPNLMFLSSHPSPFSISTVITYELRQRKNLRAVIYDLYGREIIILHEGSKESGMHEIHWDGRDSKGQMAPAGMYFCRISTQHNAITAKLIHIH